MSQETPIGNLSGGISEEDSKLVDSILNDLNSHSDDSHMTQQGPQGPQQGPQGQQRPELTPEQMKQIHMQRQMAMQQQQLMQQQQMAQQQMAQQQMAQQQMAQPQMAQQNGQGNIQNTSKEMTTGSDGIIDQIKNESKSIILVIFLSIILNLEQVDNIFKSQASLFTNESGSLNMQAIFIKALIIGFIFYGVKTYLL
jgi:flagellar motor protein MotB